MIDNSAYSEQIDRFLKGKMSVDEERKFKAAIESNAELKQLVREHLYLIRGIKQIKEQEEQLIIEDAHQAPIITPLRRNWVKITSIAATVAILMILSGIGGSHLYYRYEVRQYVYSASIVVMSDFEAASRGSMDEETKDHLLYLFGNAQTGENLSNTIFELSELYALTKDEFVDIEDDYAYQIGWFLTIAYINNKDYHQAFGIANDLANDYPDIEAVIGLQKSLDKFLK